MVREITGVGLTQVLFLGTGVRVQHFPIFGEVHCCGVDELLIIMVNVL